MNEKREKRSGVVRRRRRWLILLSAGVVCAVVAGGVANSHFTNPEYVRARAEAYLQQFLRGRVTVGAARLSWFDGIRLYDVTVTGASQGASAAASPAANHSPDNVFSCREIAVTHELLSTLTGQLIIRSIVAKQPTCLIVRDAIDSTTNLAGLWQPVDSEYLAGGAPLPTVELREARFRVISRRRGRDRVVEDFTLTVRGRSPNPRFFDVVWYDGRGGGTSGRSKIDLQTGRIRNVDGGLPWMSIEAVMIAVNASYDSAGTWAELLGLDGMVRATDYNFGSDSDVDSLRSATIELDNASLSVPINEQEKPLAAADRYLRFEQVVGTMEVTADGIHADFDALFHGARCKASATMHGGLARVTTLDDVDFKVDVSVRGLDLPRTDGQAPPDQVRFVNRWKRLSKFFHDYDPHGLVDLEISAGKQAGVDEQLVVDRVLFTARGTDASYHRFPYRLEKVTGTVEFTPSSVLLRDIRGEHAGGLVTLEGEVSPPNRHAAVELRITGAGIPIDRALYDAVPKRYRRIHDQFQPEGRVDVELTLSRPPPPDEGPRRWVSRCALSLDDVSASYDKFPYRVERLSGLLMVDNHRLEAIGVQGYSGESRISVDGTAGMGAGDSRDLQFVIRGEDVVFDDKLLAALPEQTRRSVSRFHPVGSFDIETTLTSDAGMREVRTESAVSLNGVRIKHDDLPIVIEDVQGLLQVAPEGIAVRGLSGAYRGAEISAQGYLADGTTVSPPGTAAKTTHLAVRCRDLSLDDTLLASAPVKIRDALTDWRIDTPIDVDITWRPDAMDECGDPALTAVVRMKDATVRYSESAVTFQRVRGEFTVDGSNIRATGIEARFGQAAILADLDLRTTDGREEGTITLSATGVAFDDSLRTVLPPRLRRAWDGAALTGRADVRLDRLHYVRLSPSEQRIWEVEGQIELHGASLPGITDIEDASGTITVGGFLLDRLGGVTLQGTLDLSAVDVLGQRLTDVGSTWSHAQTAGGQGRLLLDAIHGDICRGSMKARVELLFDQSQANYNLSGAVHDMDIQPFILAARSPQLAKEEPVSARGFADARLYLSGPVGDRDPNRPHRGGGRVEIRNANMYRLPIMLAILSVINLAVPDDNAFHDAEADFHIVDNRIELTDIALRGQLLTLVGHGSLSLPDRGVDMYLVNVPPWLAGIPILDVLVEGTSRKLIELHATGPLFRPTVRPVPLRSTIAEIKSLFQRKPRKITAVGN